MSDSTTQAAIVGSEEVVGVTKVNKPKPVRGWATARNGPLHWNQTGTIMAGDIRMSVEQNKKQRKTWTTFDRSSLSVHLLKANLAEDGCEEAQLDIAKKLLEENEDVGEATQRENSKKAIYWLIKSAEQGNEEATELLKQCLKSGQGITHQNISDVRSCISTPKKEKLVFKAARRLYDKLSNGEEFITTTQILEFSMIESDEKEKVEDEKQDSDKDPDSPNRTFLIHEDEELTKGPQFSGWVSEENEDKPSSLLREREGVKLTKGDLLNIARAYNEGNVPDVAISGQVWGTRHYQSLFYYLSIFLLQFLLLSMMLKACTAYTVLLVLTSWLLLWSTYGFLVWHKGISIFEEWTRAFQAVLPHNTTNDFSSEATLVSRNLLPMYGLSLIGLLLLCILSGPPTLVILMAMCNSFGVIRGVRNYRIRLQTIFMVLSTICTSPFIIGGCLQQISAIPEEDLASASEILSVAMLAVKKTLEEYVGLLPSLSLHITVAVVNLAVIAESYVHSRRPTDILEQLVLYAWFAKSVYLLPSLTLSSVSCIICIAAVLGTFFYLIDANKSLCTALTGAFISFLLLILFVLSFHVISVATTDQANVPSKVLSWKEYNENCHRKAWESISVAETRIECSRMYERSPTYVSWAGKVASVKVSDIQPLFSDKVLDEITFEVLVNVASSPWEVEADDGGSWKNLLTGSSGKSGEALNIVSVPLSTRDIAGLEEKSEAVHQLLSLNVGDIVRVQGILVNGAGGLKPGVGRAKLSRCYYCEDEADTEMIFEPTESLCLKLLKGLEDYLGAELLVLLGEAEAATRRYLSMIL